MKTGLLKTALLMTVSFVVQPTQAEMIPYEVAVLQGLNKITARVSEFKVPLNQAVRFGSLEITTKACHKNPPEDMPESAVFLQVDDLKENAEAVRMFSGWMFASSPAVSAMEHPVYDIWLVDCLPAAESQEATDLLPGAQGDTPELINPELISPGENKTPN